MLVAKIRFIRAASMLSTFICRSRMPALLTRAVSRPSSSSTVRNMRTTSASTATSAWTAIARPPAAAIAATTLSADARSRT